MTIPLVTVWADNYKTELEATFASASQQVPVDPADPTGPKRNKTVDEMWDLSKAMWGNWVNNSTNGIRCVAPITPPVTLTGTLPGAASFAPVFKGKSGVPTIALELATQFETYALGITWSPPEATPPFSEITSVKIQVASVSAAKAILLTGLTAELAAMADPNNPDAKYQALGNLFRTAFASLLVDFLGVPTSTPPPTLLISVPVL